MYEQITLGKFKHFDLWQQRAILSPLNLNYILHFQTFPNIVFEIAEFVSS